MCSLFRSLAHGVHRSSHCSALLSAVMVCCRHCCLILKFASAAACTTTHSGRGANRTRTRTRTHTHTHRRTHRLKGIRHRPFVWPKSISQLCQQCSSWTQRDVYVLSTLIIIWLGLSWIYCARCFFLTSCAAISSICQRFNSLQLCQILHCSVSSATSPILAHFVA